MPHEPNDLFGASLHNTNDHSTSAWLSIVFDILPPSDTNRMHQLFDELKPGSVRRLMIPTRDESIREARQFFPGKPTPAAAALAKALVSYLATGWRREKESGPGQNASELRKALYRIARLNAGEVLSARHIARIFEENSELTTQHR